MKRKKGGFLLVEGSLWSQLLQSKITILLRNTFLNTSQSSCSILHCSFYIYNPPSLHAPHYKRRGTETSSANGDTALCTHSTYLLMRCQLLQVWWPKRSPPLPSTSRLERKDTSSFLLLTAASGLGRLSQRQGKAGLLRFPFRPWSLKSCEQSQMR